MLHLRVCVFTETPGFIAEVCGGPVLEAPAVGLLAEPLPAVWRTWLSCTVSHTSLPALGHPVH